jgi:cytochrome c553
MRWVGALFMACTLPLAPVLAPAQAQPPAPPVPDTVAARVAVCTTCHGDQGRAGPDGFYPRLAGKPAGYLVNQLLNFQQGRRTHRLMAHLVDPLSPAYLREMANHFAALDIAYPAPLPAKAPPDVLAKGQRLAREGDPARQLPACTACHGPALTGVQPHTPGLLGLPRDYVNAQLGAWRTGTRQTSAPDCMAHMAQTLTLDDIAAVSAWLAAQPLPRDTHPAPALTTPPPLRCAGGQP